MSAIPPADSPAQANGAAGKMSQSLVATQETPGAQPAPQEALAKQAWPGAGGGGISQLYMYCEYVPNEAEQPATLRAHTRPASQRRAHCESE